MLSRDSGSHHPRPPATLGGAFTPGELERLATLRREYSGHAEHSELMIDPLQLEFMRWLYEHGRLSDSLPKPSAHARAEELTPG
jgi:hypothetical protein